MGLESQHYSHLLSQNFKKAHPTPAVNEPANIPFVPQPTTGTKFNISLTVA